MARPAEKTTLEIIEAGKAIEAETGGPVRPTQIRERIGGGNTSRIREVWDTYIRDRDRAAAVENDPDIVLPKALLDFFAADQQAQIAQAQNRFMSIYHAVKQEMLAQFSAERTASARELTLARDALHTADDENDRLSGEIQSVRRQLDGAVAKTAEEQRRADRLEGQLAAAERGSAAAQETATLARADQLSARAELAAMTERALKAELKSERTSSGGKRARKSAPANQIS